MQLCHCRYYNGNILSGDLTSQDVAIFVFALQWGLWALKAGTGSAKSLLQQKLPKSTLFLAAFSGLALMHRGIAIAIAIGS